VGGEPKARSTMWPCAFGSAQTCLIELIRPALPPPGNRWPRWPLSRLHRPLRGRLGGTCLGGLACGPASRALCAPRTTVSARYSARRSGGTPG
jgi:hypothetical protein